MPNGCVSAIVTDPPYNVGLEYADGDDRRLDYKAWSAEWFHEAQRVSSVCVAISCGVANLMAWHDIAEPTWILAWLKPNAISRVNVGLNTWEPILLYGKPAGKRTHDSFIANVSHQLDTGDHPCPKPLKWAREVIERTTEEGMSVCDPFMGTGTTGVACVKMGRQFIGIEISEHYFQICEKRIAKAQSQLAFPIQWGEQTGRQKKWVTVKWTSG